MVKIVHVSFERLWKCNLHDANPGLHQCKTPEFLNRYLLHWSPRLYNSLINETDEADKVFGQSFKIMQWAAHSAHSRLASLFSYPAECNGRTEDQADPEQRPRAERARSVTWSGESPSVTLPLGPANSLSHSAPFHFFLFPPSFYFDSFFFRIFFFLFFKYWGVTRPLHAHAGHVIGAASSHSSGVALQVKCVIFNIYVRFFRRNSKIKRSHF